MAGEVWRQMRLGDFVTLQRGHDLPNQNRRPGMIPILGSFGITGYHDEAKARGPGVTVGRSGASFGVVSYSPVDYWPLNTALYVVDFHGNDERFAYYFLQQFDFSRYNSGSAQPSLNRNFIHPIPVEVPPRNEQQAIAHILGALDDKIELNRRMNQTLEAMARAIFKSWFVDFDPVRAKAAGKKPPGLKPEIAALFPNAFENSELGEIPKGWKTGTVRECCLRVENGGTPKRQVEGYWELKEVPWLTSGEVRQRLITETENYISKTGFANSSAKMWPPFTTVVALYGATAGVTTILGIELCANQACCGLIPKDEKACFIHQTVSGSLLHLQQQTRGSAQQNLSQSIVADLPCVLPPNSCVAEFERRARYFYERRMTEMAEARTLAALRDTLLPKLVSGALRVPDAERIVGRCT